MMNAMWKPYDLLHRDEFQKRYCALTREFHDGIAFSSSRIENNQFIAPARLDLVKAISFQKESREIA